LMSTASGREVFNQMIRAREKRLESILKRWACEQRPEVRALLDRLALTLMAELPAEPVVGRRGRGSVHDRVYSTGASHRLI